MQNTSITQTQYRTFRQRPVVFLMCVAKEKMWFGIGTVMCVIIGSSISIFIPVMIGKLVDLFTIDASLQQIYIALTFLCVLFFLKDVLARLSGGVFASTWIIHMEFCAAVIPFTYLLQHSAKFFSNRMSGVLQNNVFNISRAVGSIARIALWEFLYVMMKIAVTVFIACTLHMLVGGIFAMCIGIFILYNLFIAPKITAYSYKWTKQLSHTKGLLVDTITNILAIKQHAMETEEERVITENLSTWKNIRMKGWRFFAMTTFIGNIIFLTMFVTTAFFLISLWSKEVITAGQIVALMAILVNLSGTLEFLNKSFNRFMEDYGQLKEGLEQIFVPIDITDAKDAQSVTITKGEIQFHSVDFAYQDDDTQAVFHNLSLTIPAGQKIGLVGESGSGKTTFAGLILRFMDIQNGSITIDNHNITKIPQDDLRKSIAYVPQEALLFHRTLEQNIAYGKTQINEKDLLQSAKDAHALEFINTFPKKFKTIVGERGIKLSGGQKQRVMIARAMLKKTPILILDEATSALDSHSEKLIQQALENLMKNRTTLVIAHRLSTLKKMNRIIVFDNGKIVEDGTHDELLSKKGKYWQLWEYQTGGRI